MINDDTGDESTCLNECSLSIPSQWRVLLVVFVVLIAGGSKSGCVDRDNCDDDDDDVPVAFVVEG